MALLVPRACALGWVAPLRGADGPSGRRPGNGTFSGAVWGDRPPDGTATYYVFDGEKIARVEQPEAGTRDFYVQEGDGIYSPLVSVHDQAADAQYWYLFDALGSTMGLVDANGNLSGKLQYDAFGNVLAEENVPRSAFFKYVGAYQYMPEGFEDMMLLWHRWYDPTAGRFVGRDAERPRRTNVYEYVRARPTGLIDADGERETYMMPPRFYPRLPLIPPWERLPHPDWPPWLDSPFPPPPWLSSLLLCKPAGYTVSDACAMAQHAQIHGPYWESDCKMCCGDLASDHKMPAWDLDRCERGCEAGMDPWDPHPPDGARLPHVEPPH